MSRFQASSIHLGISLAVFAAIAYAVLAIWYPSFLFQTDGGSQGLRILLGVDLVMGPLLTLIVYRAGKPGLRFDLTTIGVLQAGCLAAGIWIVHSERPLAIVYVDGSFYSVSAQSFIEAGVLIPNLESLPGDYPKWVSVDLPKDYEEQSKLRGAMLGRNRMLATLADRYVPFDPSQIDNKEARSPDEIIDQDRDAAASPAWLEEHGGGLTDYRYYPYGARYAFAYLGFDAKDGRFVGYLKTPAPR
ncbi:MAG: hypothetical protein ACREXT_19675 [Gammaproteobacteria bacterium]